MKIESYYNSLSIVKVLMAVGIVYVHIIPPSVLTTILPEHPIFNFLFAMTNETFFRGCTPTYFFIAGFMFYRGNINQKYLSKIISKAKRLLIPFVFWNSLFIVCFSLDKCDSLSSIVNMYIRPVNFPLWFLRDLFFICLLSPFIGYLLRNFRKYLPFLLMIYYIIFSCKDVSYVGIFYFTLGAYFSFTPSLMAWLMKRKLYLGIIFVLVWLIDVSMWMIGIERDFLHHAIFKLLFIFMVFSTLDIWEKHTIFTKMILPLGKASFLLYCCHLFYVAVLQFYFREIFYSELTIYVCSLYVLLPWLLFLITIFFYNILNRYTPKILQFSLGLI